MPPKRRKAKAVDGSERSDDTPRATTPKATRSATISTRLTPLPAMHSTSYGSPAPVLPLRESTKYGTDFRAATRAVLAAVREDNRKDKKLMIVREAAEAEAAALRAKEAEMDVDPSTSTSTSTSTSPEQPGDEVDLVRRREDEDEEEAARKKEAEAQASLQRQAAEKAAADKQADAAQKAAANLKAAADEKAAADRKAMADQETAADRTAALQKQADEQAALQKRSDERAARDRQAAQDEARRRQEVAEAAKLAEEKRLRDSAEEIRRLEEQEIAQTTTFGNTLTGHNQQGVVGRQGRVATEASAASAAGDTTKRYPRSGIYEGASGGFRPGAILTKRPAPETAPTSSPKRSRVGLTPLPNPRNDARDSRNPEELPDPLTLTGRSFVEESNVYNEAGVWTPSLLSSDMNDTPSRTDLPTPQLMGRGDNASSSWFNPVSRALNLRTRFNGFATRDHQLVTDHITPSRQTAALQQEPADDTSVAHTEPRTGTKKAPKMNGPPTTPRRSRRLRQAHEDPADDAEDERPPETSSRRPKPSSTSGTTTLERSALPRTNEQVETVSRPLSGSGRSQRRGTSATELATSDDSTSELKNPDDDPDSPELGNPPDHYSFEWFLATAKRGSKALSTPAGSVIRWLAYISLTLLVLRLWYASGSPEIANARISPTIGWYGWTDWSRNIGQFVPYTLRHPLGCITDDEYNALRYFVDSQGDEIARLAGASQVTSLATAKLENILPQAVWAKQDKRGKLVITQEFWHALKDFIHDESVLTLEAQKDGTKDISDPHWSALQKRLESGFPGQDDRIKGVVERTISNSWQNWLKNNHEKVNKILSSSSGKGLPAAAEERLLSRAEKLIQERLSAKGLKDIVVSREEFVREIENSLAVYKREIQAEFLGLQDKLVDLAERVLESKSASGTAGLSRNEVIALTNDIVRKAIGDAQLEAAAKGSIGTNFEAELGRRVNYFGLGNGAAIDSDLTSPTYNHPRQPISSRSWLNFKPVVFQTEKFAALTSWEEAGHCWCAASRFEDNIMHPADISIKLPQSIIPENVVIEHIDPSATRDPNAMPKQIEVWAVIDEYTRRELARDFMMTQYPSTRPDHPLLARGFLKIGEFTYEHNAATNGVQVYKVSSEYARMDFMTDHVLIRAVSNHGADHTCFYRVRLYGEPRDLDDARDTRL